jgi:hypothetical protein
MNEFIWYSIFSYEGMTIYTGLTTFYKVKFLKDFGKIKKDSEFTFVNFCLSSGKIECWNAKTATLTCQNFYFSPVEIN